MVALLWAGVVAALVAGLSSLSLLATVFLLLRVHEPGVVGARAAGGGRAGSWSTSLAACLAVTVGSMVRVMVRHCCSREGWEARRAGWADLQWLVTAWGKSVFLLAYITLEQLEAEQ